jgi:AcrR family transcriptional regulator
MATDIDPAERPLRRDVRRNRAKLLAVAAEVFAADGTNASLEEVARRAGVGPGTLYRHFPTRQDLLVALLRDRVDALTARATQLLADSSPADALRIWLEAVARHTSTYRGLPDVLKASAGDAPSDVLAACHQQMRSTGAALVKRARDAGVLREDVEVSEVFQLVDAVAWATEQSAPHTGRMERLLTLVLEGLQPR